MLDSVDASAAPSTQTRTWSWHDRKANWHWVFGMRWLPALGPRAQKAMQRNLREQGFAWAVNHGKQVRLIGVQPQGGTESTGNRIASAAVAFASLHPQGVHALCLEVQGSGVWLVAACEGSVLSDTDRWFDTLTEAQACLQALRERHEQLVIVTSQWNPEAVQADEDSQPVFLQANLAKRCKFCRLPSSNIRWLVVGLMVVGMGVGAALAYQHWLDADPLSPTDHDVFVPEPAKPQSVLVHGHDALQTLVESWHHLPVDPAGWLLHSVACRFELDQAFCKAAYKRRDSGAHNEALASHAPVGWQFEPDSLDQAWFKRTIKLPVQPLLPHMRASTTFGLAQLQRLSPRVAALTVGHVGKPEVMQAGPVPAESALRRGHGTLDLTEPSVARLSARNVTFRLALRQVERMRALNLPLRWRQADLSLIHGAQIDKLHGYLMLNLQGEWLETH